MSEKKIHPTAVIHSKAKIGKDVTIEPYVFIGPDVTLEDGVTVKAHAYIEGHTRIGENTIIYPSASIGTKAQALKYRGEVTYIEIGKNCEIREFVTINSSIHANSILKIGDSCLIMAYCHIAHNSVVGNHVVLNNNATLAGHVVIEDFAIIGGMTAIHQFCRIGAYAMVGGKSGVTRDIPPYTLGTGFPYRFGG